MKNENMQTKLENSDEQESGFALRDADYSPPYEGLSVWQIQTIRWEDDDRQKGKEWNTTIVCKDIEAVWKWIELDRNDLRTEIRAINHIAHACAVIPFIPENVQADLPATVDSASRKDVNAG